METKELDYSQLKELDIETLQKGFRHGERLLGHFYATITNSSFVSYTWYEGNFDYISIRYQTFPSENAPKDITVRIDLKYSNKPPTYKLHKIPKGEYLNIQIEPGLTSVGIVCSSRQNSGIPSNTYLSASVTKYF
ncbi:hypothetical protein [Aquimarina sp. AU119]|uniref:hypothetical protein n=1 Tax=Aquimarina sp. AU119 TaxID=2108528 RepID=UPI000D695894|nr:hypothetical protein [Aquimarina sp. AU119]